MKSRKSHALAAGALSGLLCFLAFPPVDLGFLGFVALAPLSWIFFRSSRGQLAIASTAFGLAFFGPLIWWIRLFGLLPYVGLVLAQSLWVIAALQAGHFMKAPLSRTKHAWVVLAAFPIAFLAGEYLRSHLPLGGFGWGGLGYTQHENPVALKLAPYTGVWGLTLLLAVFNTVSAEAIVNWRRRPRASAGMLAAVLVIALSPALLPVQGPNGKHAKIAMVQGNVPENTYDPNSDDFIVLDNHLRLTERLRPREASLIVWPEGAFDRDPSNDDRLGDPLLRMIREKKSPFHVGAILSADPDKGRTRNASLFFAPDGTLAGVYTKQHPVPFGEYVPFRRILTPWIKALERVPHDQVPGEESTVFALPEGNFASIICYESTYPGLVRSFVNNGARLLVVSTNDSSFGRSAASEQHLAFSRLRAAEHRMWVAHTAVSGVSAVIGPDGGIIERSNLFEPRLFLAQMRFAVGTTVYAKLGDWLPRLAIAVLGLLIAGEMLMRSKLRRALSDTPQKVEEEAAAGPDESPSEDDNEDAGTPKPSPLRC